MLTSTNQKSSEYQKTINRLKEEEERLKEDQRLETEQSQKQEEKINLEEKIKLDKQNNKEKFNGKVKWFNGAKGYGFIEREDGEKDIFVHLSAVKDSGLKYLKTGEELTFEIENTERGLSATNLQKHFNL